MAYLNLASLRERTEAEGPGKRFAVWCQGCMKRCPSCCNAEMQEIKKNLIVDTSDLIQMIEESMVKNQIEGVSFIGGEPMLQAEGFCEVAKWCQKNDLSVLIFTGYTFDELRSMKSHYVNELLTYTDVLVDGPFIVEDFDEKRDWVGSTNQKVHLFSDRYSKGIETECNNRSIEICVTKDEIYLNGWPYKSED